MEKINLLDKSSLDISNLMYLDYKNGVPVPP